MKTTARPYSKARLARLVKTFGSITKTAHAAHLSAATLTKFIAGKRKNLSRITCTALDVLYNETF